MELEFLGATGTVTGSRHLVTAGRSRVLVDCGLFQGFKQLRLRNWAPPPFSVSALDAVVLTHAHLDHSGYLPLLVKRGYRGPVYCTPATRDLCGILLPDSGRLQEEEAAHANRAHWSKHSPALPLYTEADALAALRQLKSQDFGAEFRPAGGVSARFLPAGHILGAALVELTDGATRVLFTGDLGRPHDPVMQAPAFVDEADYLVMESTYGDRTHDAGDPADALGEIIRRVSARGGVVVIPSFAVGRAQALLWCIHRLKTRRQIPTGLPVFLNSPMAADATS